MRGKTTITLTTGTDLQDSKENRHDPEEGTACDPEEGIAPLEGEEHSTDVRTDAEQAARGDERLLFDSPEADPDVFDAEAGPDPVGGGPAEVLEATEAAVTGEAESVFGTGYLNEVDIIK